MNFAGFEFLILFGVVSIMYVFFFYSGCILLWSMKLLDLSSFLWTSSKMNYAGMASFENGPKNVFGKSPQHRNHENEYDEILVRGQSQI